MLIIKYLFFSISLTFLSWIIAMLTSPIMVKSKFHQEYLSNLNFIKSDVINKIIGIGIIKWIVINTFFKNFNPKLKLNGEISFSNLNLLRKEMTKSEIDHLIGFAYIMIFVFIKIFSQEYLFGLVMLVINILMNLYPSLLQQHNKRRIDRLISKYF